jgi:hypothetical protein
VWWLWKDGVYQWGSEGIRSISDGKVKSWFATNDYFNRTKFPDAYAIFDQDRLKYKLYLASAGSDVIDSWVEYDIQTENWWGPHTTEAFTPTCSFYMYDADEQLFPLVGSSDAFTWRETTTPHDHLATGIPFEVISKYHDGGDPMYEKHWGQPMIYGKPQSAGQLVVTPITGFVDDPEGVPVYFDMTKGKEQLGRLGTGPLLRLRLTHDVYNEPVQIYGIQVPYNGFGVR